MATTIIIKNSAVAGKVPDASALATAELALNLNDRKLYSKDSSGNVFELGGGGANVPGGDTPPGSGNEIGDLFFDTTLNQLLYWDGTDWVPIAGDEVQSLDDLDDVTILNPSEGELLVWNGTNWENADPGYLTEEEIINILNGLNPDGTDNPNNDGYLKPGDDVSELENDAGYLTEAEVINILEGNNPDGTDKPDGEEYAKLTDIGDGTVTIVDSEGDPVGEFTVNQDGDTEIVLPEIPVPEDQIHIGDTYPGTPSLGDLWVNTGECPPQLLIWDDCDDPGNPEWTPIGGETGRPPVIGSVTLSEDDETGTRFTDQSFTTAVVMADDGDPASTKGIVGMVKGELGGQPISDEIIAVDTTSVRYSDGVFKDPSDSLAYDPTAATSQSGFAAPYTNVFDGDETTAAVVSGIQAASTWIYLKNLGQSGVTSLELKIRQSEGLKIDGVDYTTDPDGDEPVQSGEYIWKTVLNPPASFDLIAIQGNRGQLPGSLNGSCAGVKVNGKLLVDGQPVTTLTFKTDKDLAKFEPGDAVQQENSTNDEPTWSEYLTATEGFRENFGPERAFNGNTAQGVNGSSPDSAITFTPPGGLTVNTKIEMWTKSTDLWDNKILINGNDTGVH